MHIQREVLIAFVDQQSVASKIVDHFPPEFTDQGHTVVVDGIKCIPLFPAPIIDGAIRRVTLVAAEKFLKAELALVKNDWQPLPTPKALTILHEFPQELNETVLDAYS